MPSTKVTTTKAMTNPATKSKVKNTTTAVAKVTTTVKKAELGSSPVGNTESDGLSGQARILELQTAITEYSIKLRSLTRELQKEYAKDLRKVQRQTELALKKKNKKSSGNTTVSGIAKPGYISPELCKFIGKDVGTEMARTEVIKHVNAYIKEHGLQDAKNKRIIRPDSKLQSLLKTKKSDEVTYFNLQTYMKRHYANPAKVVINT